MKLLLSSHGRMVSMRSSGFGKVADVLPNVPFDPIVKRHIVRPQDFPQLVEAAVAAGVELVPDLDFAAFLRYAADDLDGQAAFIKSMPAKFYSFQRRGSAFLRSTPVAFLFDDMGLGKTPQSLVAAGRRVLVVCPASLRLNWKREVARWRPDLQPVVIKSRNSFRWPEEGEAVIVSYAGTAQKPKNAPPGVTLIADEAHLVKEYKAARTKRFRLLSRRAIKARGEVWLMTGTPVLKNPKELWGLLQAVELGRTLYGSWSKYTKAFGGYVDSLGVVHWDAKKVKPDAMTPLRGYVLRRKREDVLKDMPAKSRTDRTVDLVKMDRETAALVATVTEEVRELLLDAGEAYLASLDYFDGIDGLAASRAALAAAKIPALAAVVDEYRQAGEPLVVFSAHRAPIEYLQSLPGWGAIHGGVTQKARDAAVADFQAGRLAGIACTIGAAGMGYTLTRAATAVFVDSDWTPAMNRQAEDRVARIGQTRPVSIVRLVADHDLDQMIARLLARKIEMMDSTTEVLNEPTGPEEYDPASIAENLRHFAALIGSAD